MAEARLSSWRMKLIALIAVTSIVAHLVLWFLAPNSSFLQDLPLFFTLVVGGIPLVVDLFLKMLRFEFGSDLLAGISIVTAVLLDEYLAGCFVVLMLSGGEAIEEYAVARASSVLKALADRLPAFAHKQSQDKLEDVAISDVNIGDVLSVFPHEVCPVDGTVLEGNGVMDESYLTGEPYMMSKAPGSTVLSGAINGEDGLVIRADKLAVDSRYAKIMEVMKESEQHRPRIRRLGDRIGAIYTPIAVTIAVCAWLATNDPVRFLAVLVVATPCPLLIAIPVALIGSISLAARRGIIVRNPSILETIDTCTTIIFDKTGTLTYGKPVLVEELLSPAFEPDKVLTLVASLERYSKHPLSNAVSVEAKRRGIQLETPEKVSEEPGTGLTGSVGKQSILVTSRKVISQDYTAQFSLLPDQVGGMECVIVIDGRYAATYRFRDTPRADGASFIHHLKPYHQFDRVMIVSGDRESEVRYLAEQVGIKEVHSDQSPEEKLDFVRNSMTQSRTLFLGDGINDAPALTAATVGIAFGENSDVTSEAADAVIMDSSLTKVDELMHISRRMRRIALQSAIGGMLLSIVGMGFAAAGYLAPIGGAMAQEVIDVIAVLNALRAAHPPRQLSDFD